MGLDMYLYAKLSTFTMTKEVSEDIKKVVMESKTVSWLPNQIESISFDAIYWRKANAIHQWFVDNVQDGEDNCRRHYVSIEDLEKLLNVVNKVLSDNSLANELLPPQSGFFFGSTEIDETYFNDLQYTKEKLEEILEDKESAKKFDFIYQSSW